MTTSMRHTTGTERDAHCVWSQRPTTVRPFAGTVRPYDLGIQLADGNAPKMSGGMT